MAFFWRFLFLLVALSCVAISSANSDRKINYISEEQFDELKLMSEYAAAAYCTSNIGTVGDKLACIEGTCPKVEAANTSSIAEYERLEKSTDVTGFVALDHSNKRIIASFRGSATLDNWRANLKFTETDTDICKNCPAHEGFWKSWLETEKPVKEAIQEASKNYPDYQITTTGHSLGGAIATLAAASMRESGLSVAMYSYGSPRVGKRKISKHISKQPGGNFRVTHRDDPIPRLPFEMLFGFSHISPEYFIKTKDSEEVLISDIKKIRSGSTLFEGNGAWFLSGLDAHTWYFGRMFPCTAPPANPKRMQVRGAKQDAEIVATF